MFSFCSYAPFASTPSFLNNVPAKVEWNHLFLFET
jgi:hypothetical protein